MNLDRYVITASYATCCFCDKPELPSSKQSYAFKPRWQFAKAVKEYASDNNIHGLVMNGTSDHSAIGLIDTPCKHQQQQTVRLEWEFEGWTPKER